MVENFLFLGAGFSKNFGLPLSDDIWGKIFNSNLLKKYPEIESLLKKYHNYENIYFEILNGRKFKKNPDLQKYFKKLILDIYSEMDDMVISYLRSDNNRRINLYQLKKFINRFCHNNDEPGIIFSINQDLFIERFYMNPSHIDHNTLVIPFLKSQWNICNSDISMSPFKSSNAENTSTSKSDFLNPLCISNKLTKKKRHDFMYIKLHGSFDWRKKNKDDVMIIGTNKLDLIRKYKILNENYTIFKNSLKNKDENIIKRILLIGYSFNDSHINKILETSKTELHVIDPQNPKDFYDKMTSSPVKQRIWQNNIKKYYCCTLEDVFPSIGPKSSILLEIEKYLFEE